MINRYSGLLMRQMLSRVLGHAPVRISVRNIFTQSQRVCQRRRMLSKVFEHKWIIIRSESHSAPKGKKLINITPVSVIVSVIFSGVLFGIYVWLERTKHLNQTEGRIAALSESGIGTLNWSLIDQTGTRKQYSEFRGQWLIIYFGFCHCPDICPDELEKLTLVVEGIDSNTTSPDVQPIFITLDPERDTAQFMNQYCKEFSSKLIGFTGSKEEIDKAAKSYKAYYSLGEKDADGDYIVDHTICMYLINPDGKLIDVYERRAKVEEIVKGSVQHMADYTKLKSRRASAS